MDKQNRMWVLLAKKSAGEADEDELKELDEWMKQEGEGVQYMTGTLEHYWDTIEKAPENAALLRSGEQRIDRAAGSMITADPLQAEKAGHIVIWKKTWLRAAAAAVFLLGGWFVYRSFDLSRSEMNIVATKSGSKTKVTLPDGTQVWLNADSKLTYPNDFQHIARREVRLCGEAYFKVKHDADHPFVIHTKYLNVVDIGTEFNLKAYPEDEESEATLVRGAISVSLRDDPGKNLLLKPGEKVMYYASDGGMTLQANKTPVKVAKHKDLRPLHIPARLEVTTVKPLVIASGDSVVAETAWMNNQLVFSGEKFSELARRLARWYDVEITIKSNQVNNYTFTGIFEGETLEQALKELQMIRPFSFSISKDHVTINGSGP